MRIRLALAQINTVVGDFDHNRRQIVRWLDTARELDADVVVFPELVITGYPPEDLLLKPDFVAAANASLHALLPATRGLTAVVGCLDAGEDLFSGAAVIHDGEIVGIYHKRYLPNYGVFDERRYFQSGREQLLFRLGDAEMGVSICEDIWYPGGPPSEQALRGGAELLVNISASPYQIDKGDARERMLATRAADNTAFIGYCNLVGGQDELVFDGRSLICGPDGQILARGKEFEEDLVVADLDLSAVFRQRLFDPRRRDAPHDVSAFERRVVPGFTPHTPKKDVEATQSAPHSRVGAAYAALTLGTRDYVRKNGFKHVVLGLSGGIDSALTAVIAADALGPENVTGVAMPTRYSSSHSLEDARQLADNLGLNFLKIPVDTAFQAFLDTLAPLFEGLEPDVTEENLQPRTRGTILMALSNKFGWLVLTTGNKSEISVGYVTLYGDTVGGFAVLKDVYKELVYELARYRNEQAGFDVIPARVLEKPPSAELRPDQKDTDSLPPYETLDAILHAYIEERHSAADIVALGFDPATVGRVIRMVDRNEFKRRQSAPGVKLTTRAFGRDWRPPITNHYDETKTLSTDQAD